LTGDERAIAELVGKYRVNVVAAPNGDPARLGRSSFLYLRGKDGGFPTLIMPGASAEEIATRLTKYAD
jgi:hypothetical protein